MNLMPKLRLVLLSLSVTMGCGGGGIVWDEEAPPGGDVAASATGTRASRTFPAQGDYDYHSTVNRDIKGRVRVR
jgi:hypothetical protein